MKLLSHPNIVKLIDVIEKADECTTYLIAGMTYLPSLSLIFLIASIVLTHSL
jgi:hypothetical protein